MACLVENVGKSVRVVDGANASWLESAGIENASKIQLHKARINAA
jgi:hypothetical protein